MKTQNKMTHKFAHEVEIASKKEKMILKATYGALTCSAVLAILKFVNYFITGSAAIHASALDSIMDLAVSAANFMTIHIIRRKATKRFPKGFDKIAPLIAILQVVLVSMLAVYLLKECFEKLTNPAQLESAELGLYIILFALALNSILVWYQSKVVKATGSIIIKADMLHYKTDFLTNLAIFLGIIFITNFNIYWLDPVLGICAAVYLLIAVVSLFKVSLRALIDISNEKLAKKVHNQLSNLDIKYSISEDDIFVLFSGMEEKIYVRLHHINEKELHKIQQHIKENFKEKVELVLI